MLPGTNLMLFGVDADWCSGGGWGIEDQESWFAEGSE